MLSDQSVSKRFVNLWGSAAGLRLPPARGLSSLTPLGFEREGPFHCFGPFVPEGHSTIAQRFSVGIHGQSKKVPKGRLRNATGMQPSLRDLEGVTPFDPTLKRVEVRSNM
jgi:hypothetical protein